MAIREILVPCDLSQESEAAVEHAEMLARRFAARLTLYHVAEIPDHRYAHWAFAHGHEIWDQAEKSARDFLESRANRLDVKRRALVERRGSAVRAILDRIRDDRPDVTVMAAHHQSLLGHPFLGSTTESVMQQSCRAVLCLRNMGEPDGSGYRRILVPTDVSEASRRAFPVAVELAKAFDSELIAVHVVRPHPLATLSGIPEMEPEDPARRKPDEASLLRFLDRDGEGVALTAQVHVGVPWERICHAALETEADLIVSSRSGNDSFGSRLLGGTTARIARNAPCPVWAV